MVIDHWELIYLAPKDLRNIYTVLSDTDDSISLKFADGIFGNLPQGNFKVYYRRSKNQNIRITPADMQNIQVDVQYVSSNNQIEVLTLTFGLQYTVDNATTSETNDNIRLNAPATYYTQNRMITGEDYQVAPLGTNQEIIKVKATNRINNYMKVYSWVDDDL